ncbi:hypothetical protein D9M71_777000 [compost metagenome]
MIAARQLAYVARHEAETLLVIFLFPLGFQLLSQCRRAPKFEHSKATDLTSRTGYGEAVDRVHQPSGCRAPIQYLQAHGRRSELESGTFYAMVRQHE